MRDNADQLLDSDFSRFSRDRGHFQVATFDPLAILAPTIAKLNLRPDSARSETKQRKQQALAAIPADERADELSTNKMVPGGAWLHAGAAVVDCDGRIVESNEEFAAWAGLSRFQSASFDEVLAQKCPAWKTSLHALLAAPAVFSTSQLEDIS